MPPDNDVDVFAHDLGFIAILDKGKIAGWNVTIGGGMGMTHGDTKTFPRTGDVMGFCTSEQVVDVAEKVVTVQRDWGNRELSEPGAPQVHHRDARPRRLPRRGREAAGLQARRGSSVQVHLDGRCDRLAQHESRRQAGEGQQGQAPLPAKSGI